jgi:hypothetical protein
MADIEAPSALRTRFGTWTPAHAQAWSDLIRTLQRGRYITNASTVDLAGVERAFLTAFNHSGINVEADGDIAAALDGTATARAAMFDRIFRMYAQNRGSIGAMMNVSDSDTTTGSVRIDSPPSTIPSTFRAQPPSSFTAPTGQTREVAWAEQRQKEWTQLTARLRAAGYLPGDGTPSEQDVYRAFLKSQQSPTDRDANEIGRAPELTDPELLSAFNAAYAARQTPRYREDGSEITLASPPTAAPDAPPSAPQAITAADARTRYTAMNAALKDLPPEGRAHFNTLLAPQGPLTRPMQVRPEGRGAVGQALQRFALAAVGASQENPANMVRRIQDLVTAETLPEGSQHLAPYVAAVRAQLQHVLQRLGNRAPQGEALQRLLTEQITGWVRDGHAGATTDLAVLIGTRESVTIDTATSPTRVFDGWARSIVPPGTATVPAASALIGTPQAPVLSAQAHTWARAQAQQPGTPAPPPSGPP